MRAFLATGANQRRALPWCTSCRRLRLRSCERSAAVLQPTSQSHCGFVVGPASLSGLLWLPSCHEGGYRLTLLSNSESESFLSTSIPPGPWTFFVFVNLGNVQLLSMSLELRMLCRILLLGALAFNLFASDVFALRTTPGSPCQNACHQASEDTTPEEIVCLDADYNSTVTGSNFQKCLECELQSTYWNPSSGETDVLWGLCMFCLHILVRNVARIG